jgi:pimeloyl-ACP methyl ester carboxylesterase
MTAKTAAPTTESLKVPGATLTYDIRRNQQGAEPTLLLIGSPMGAAGFATLATHFPHRTVVTYDPRGVERSEKDDLASPVDPDIHADDIHRIIDAMGDAPVDIFASSGGAVNAIALVAGHPERVRTLVAHEPPLASVLPDRDEALKACRAVAETYQRSGLGHGMANFMVVVSHEGPFAADFAKQPIPEPGDFGLPEEDDGSRVDPLLGQNMITCTHYEPDLGALRLASTRIVLAAGEQSGETMASRAAHALAGDLGMEATLLPGDHGGFLGGEYGQMGDPEAFGPALRFVLAS